jgi:hypothetical protein
MKNAWHYQPVRSAYQPPASSAFLSEETSHTQPASSTFLSEQTSTSNSVARSKKNAWHYNS